MMVTTMAVFAYLRVSTTSQTTENQKLEIKQAGITVDYWFADNGVSGSRPAATRPEFQRLLTQIRDGETLVVSKLDRLGRDAIDVQQTIKSLQARNIKVVVLALGQTDLTSPTGNLLMTMLAAVSQMERELIVERVQSGLNRAKAEGKKLGRKPKTTTTQKREIMAQLNGGSSVSEVARTYGVSRATIIGIREKLGENVAPSLTN